MATAKARRRIRARQTPPTAPTITSFAASAMVIDAGSSINFTWTLSGSPAVSQVLTPGDGSTAYSVGVGTLTRDHTYASGGTFVASLTVINGAGADTETIPDIVVSAATPPLGANWFDWSTEQPFTSMTETRRNITGSTVSQAPISFMASFHLGEVPTTKKLQLRDPSNNVVASGKWQWDSRVTYPDGSLQSCWVRVLGPASLAHTSAVTYTVDTTTGAWPTETSPSTTGIVTSATDFWIELDDIRLIGSPQGSMAQSAYSTPTLEFNLNRALGVSGRTRKDVSGPVMDSYYTHEKLQPPGGGTGDSQLWAECWVRVWKDPDAGGAVVHRSVHPLLYNGWARVLGMAKGFKMRAMNGATVLRNYASTLDRTVSDFDLVSDSGNRRTFTDDTTDLTTFDFRQGNAVKISGSPPSGIQSGKIYPVSRYGGGDNLSEYSQQVTFSLQNLHDFDGTSNFRSGGIYDPVHPGSGGGTFTMTCYNIIFDQQMFAIRDGDGEPFWLTGGGELTPYWTRAEKIRRMQTGQVIPTTIDENYSFIGDFSGLTSNYPKNTSLIPEHNHKHKFQPGAAVYHRNSMEAAGEWYQLGRHLNEISVGFLDVMNDMANPSIPWDRILRMSAAEAICFQRLNCAENATDGSGNEYAHPIIVNNGPDKDGVAYPNCGPCWPTAHALNSGTSSGIRGPASGSGASAGGQQENEMSQWAGGGDSGSHASKEFAFTYIMYGDPSDLRACQGQWTRHLVCANNGMGPYPGQDLYGTTKTHNGVTYYGVTVIGTTNANQPRAHIGRNHMLAYSLYTPDNDPLSPYIKDMAKANFDFLEAFYDDPNMLGTRGKTLGPMMGISAGNQQMWQMQRIAIAGLLQLKRSGHVAPNSLKYLTAFARWALGHAEYGPGNNQATGGFTGAIFGIATFSYFDNVYETSDPTNTTVRSVMYRFLDDAATELTASSQAIGWAGDFPTIRTDSTFDVVHTFATAAMPNNDDQVFFVTPNNGALASGLNYQTWYHLYDKTFVSGNTYRFKFSSTPGPSYTQVLVSAASNVSVNFNNIQLRYATKRTGPVSPSGIWRVKYSGTDQADMNRDYLNNITAPVNVAYTMFGPAFPTLENAANAFITFTDTVLSDIGVDYYDRAHTGGSWCFHRPYAPDAT